MNESCPRLTPAFVLGVLTRARRLVAGQQAMLCVPFPKGACLKRSPHSSSCPGKMRWLQGGVHEAGRVALRCLDWSDSIGTDVVAVSIGSRHASNGIDRPGMHGRFVVKRCESCRPARDQRNTKHHELERTVQPNQLREAASLRLKENPPTSGGSFIVRWREVREWEGEERSLDLVALGRVSHSLFFSSVVAHYVHNL